MCVHIHVKKHTNTQVEALPMSEKLNEISEHYLLQKTNSLLLPSHKDLNCYFVKKEGIKIDSSNDGIHDQMEIMTNCFVYQQDISIDKKYRENVLIKCNYKIQ